MIWRNVRHTPMLHVQNLQFLPKEIDVHILQKPDNSINPTNFRIRTRVSSFVDTIQRRVQTSSCRSIIAQSHFASADVITIRSPLFAHDPRKSPQVSTNLHGTAFQSPKWNYKYSIAVSKDILQIPKQLVWGVVRESATSYEVVLKDEVLVP